MLSHVLNIYRSVEAAEFTVDVATVGPTRIHAESVFTGRLEADQPDTVCRYCGVKPPLVETAFSEVH